MGNSHVFVAALDLGNGELKIMSDAVDSLSVGGILGRYKDSLGKSRLSKEESNEIMYQVESDDQKFVIGYEDVDRLRVTPLLVSGRDGLSRYSQPLFANYAKIGLAKSVGSKRPSQILLITSTPARDYLDSRIRDKLTEILQDVHKIKQNDECLILNVLKYEPMSETEAVLYDLYLDQSGFVQDESVENQDIVVINAGFGTTDISYYSKLEYRPLYKETIKFSYFDVLQECRVWLETTLNKEISVQEIAIQLSKQKARKDKTFHYVDEEVPGFGDIYKDRVNKVYQYLQSELNQIIPDPDRYHRIPVVGGAATPTIWGDQFQAWSRRVSIPSDPQFAAVRGMYKYGRYLANEMDGEETAAAKE